MAYGPDDLRIDGSRLYLRALREDDGANVVRWRSDPTVRANLFSERGPTPEEHSWWFSAYRSRSDRLELVIIERAEERPVGTVSLIDIDVPHRSAEYGILIGEPAARGKGFAHEASALVLTFAFETILLDTVILRCFADNAPARRLYERLGFCEDPRLAGGRFKGTGIRATIGMRIDRTEWPRRARAT